jgi:hypothetical protein
MKYSLVLLLFVGLFVGAGCSKTDSNTAVQESATNCKDANSPYACFLDKATSSKDPNLCNNVGAKRMICYSAYAEILTKQVDCNLLDNPTFKNECRAYISKQNKQDPLPMATTTEPIVDSEYMNN